MFWIITGILRPCYILNAIMRSTFIFPNSNGSLIFLFLKYERVKFYWPFESPSGLFLVIFFRCVINRFPHQ